MRLLTFSNYVPEQIYDVIRFDGCAESGHGFRQPFYCQYLCEFISQVCDDDTIDGAIIPCTCDSSRCVAAHLRDCGKFVYELHIPVENTRESVAQLTQALIDYKMALERLFGAEISNEQIAKRCDVAHKRGLKLSELYERLSELSYADYLRSINSMLKAPLSDWQTYTNISERKPTAERVFVIGSFVNALSTIAEMELAGLTVVGDNVTNSRRLPRVNFSTTPEKVFADIAMDILNARTSPVLDRFDRVLEHDIAEIRLKQVRAAIFLTQKHCEPYDYLFALYKAKLEELGIHCFKVIQSEEQGGRNRTVFETIASMIGGERNV